MEANVCDVNRLDSDVLLPPRKRLLAGLKKQNSDVNGNVNGIVNGNGIGNGNSLLNELDSRISYLLKAHLSNDNPSEEEIMEASRAAAEAAVKVALTARAAAQEKAVIASKAMAAAKKALEIVANLDNNNNQEIGGSVRKNKSVKQVELQMLYNNKKPRLDNNNNNNNNGKADDEEVARKLHQAMNSSPRITKVGGPSDVKSPKQKKLKSSISLGNDRISNGSIPGLKISPFSNDKEVENTIKSNTENGSKAKSGDEDITTTLGRKRGRMKQKKLPLSICHDRDQATLKEDGNNLRSPLSAGPSASSVERGTLWKCQSFKAPACVKQNKVMQS